MHVHVHEHVSDTYLTEINVQYSEDNGERELGSVDGQEPLRCIHVCLYPIGLEMLVEVEQVFLQDK